MSDPHSIPHIIVVDDDAALLQALPEALQLRMHPISIDIADTAQAALVRIAETDYDAIITDIKMPGMDGLTLLQRIRELRPETPSLLITGHGEHDLAIQALRYGAYDFVQKPIERDYFVSSLRRAIQTRQLKRQVEAQRLALEHHAAELERIVEERTRALVEANQAKDNFLSIASHELKTPLTTMKVLTQLTHRRLAQTQAPEVTYLERMDRAIGRMEMLVNDLLDVSRIEAGKLVLRCEPTDLVALVRQATHEQAAFADRVVTLHTPDEPLEVEVDPERIWQVMTNLLTNAFKYSPKEKAVAVSLVEHGMEALICVRDEGDGIPPEQAEHVFERFYRVPDARIWHGSGVGLGLGLYISSEIVERHGGRIWVESTEGVGSAFYVSLSRVPMSSRTPPKLAPSLAESDHRAG